MIQYIIIFDEDDNDKDDELQLIFQEIHVSFIQNNILENSFLMFRKEVTFLLVAFLTQMCFERVLGSFEMLTLLRSHYSSIMLH